MLSDEQQLFAQVAGAIVCAVAAFAPLDPGLRMVGLAVGIGSVAVGGLAALSKNIA